MNRKYVTKPGPKTRKDGTIYIGRVPAEFGCKEIANLIDTCEKNGYTLECIAEGVCGYGKMILWAPVDGYENIMIREVPKTCWSSLHTVERFDKLYPELEAEIEECRTASEALEG